MKIAFASCINTHAYPDQPVWKNIASHNPDVLLLLGDNIYLDIPWVEIVASVPVHPADASDQDFLRHGHKLYQELLSQPDFLTLITRPNLLSYAIWDDHDFLWNDAAGGAISKVVQGGKMRASAALHWQFREALRNKNPSMFPSNFTDPVLCNPNETAPGYSCIDLGNDLYLHLTDGRSFRTAHTMLGSTQRDQISDAIQEHGSGIHLIAAGNVVRASNGERWEAYPEDYQWLLNIAAHHKILVFSGDIHKNYLPDPLKLVGGPISWLHEATSSGAAIGHELLVQAGKQKHNFGIADIDFGNRTININLHKDADGSTEYSRQINIAAWA